MKAEKDCKIKDNSKPWPKLGTGGTSGAYYIQPTEDSPWVRITSGTKETLPIGDTLSRHSGIVSPFQKGQSLTLTQE